MLRLSREDVLTRVKQFLMELLSTPDVMIDNTQQISINKRPFASLQELLADTEEQFSARIEQERERLLHHRSPSIDRLVALPLNRFEPCTICWRPTAVACPQCQQPHCVHCLFNTHSSLLCLQDYCRVITAWNPLPDWGWSNGLFASIMRPLSPFKHSCYVPLPADSPPEPAHIIYVNEKGLDAFRLPSFLSWLSAGHSFLEQMARQTSSSLIAGDQSRAQQRAQIQERPDSEYFALLDSIPESAEPCIMCHNPYTGACDECQHPHCSRCIFSIATTSSHQEQKKFSSVCLRDYQLLTGKLPGTWGSSGAQIRDPASPIDHRRMSLANLGNVPLPEHILFLRNYSLNAFQALSLLCWLTAHQELITTWARQTSSDPLLYYHHMLDRFRFEMAKSMAS